MIDDINKVLPIIAHIVRQTRIRLLHAEILLYALSIVIGQHTYSTHVMFLILFVWQPPRSAGKLLDVIAQCILYNKSG